MEGGAPQRTPPGVFFGRMVFQPPPVGTPAGDSDLLADAYSAAELNGSTFTQHLASHRKEGIVVKHHDISSDITMFGSIPNCISGSAADSPSINLSIS